MPDRDRRNPGRPQGVLRRLPNRLRSAGLSRSVRERRLKLGLSQVELASRLGSSQSRVAKLEGADATVSLDLLIRGLLALGASRREIGRALAE